METEWHCYEVSTRVSGHGTRTRESGGSEPRPCCPRAPASHTVCQYLPIPGSYWKSPPCCCFSADQLGLLCWSRCSDRPTCCRRRTCQIQPRQTSTVQLLSSKTQTSNNIYSWVLRCCNAWTLIPLGFPFSCMYRSSPTPRDGNRMTVGRSSRRKHCFTEPLGKRRRLDEEDRQPCSASEVGPFVDIQLLLWFCATISQASQIASAQIQPIFPNQPIRAWRFEPTLS
ncbi:hypothetical protein LX32DRAFT_287155 [Colletotrichum zoysiae]|uniref:Uncharacterized protein n=1 Tax=Colletotrichum zoysiae TaxID=1216348 RepID=A0AAD9H1U2_9PEZI|nr:hypothetical protein LX32DRAFT_287155 [Colletotrichum zoysiae]